MTAELDDLRNELKGLTNTPAGVWTRLNCYDCMSTIDQNDECECDAPILFDPLDVEFTVTREGRVIGVNVLVDAGGPHIQLKAREGSNLSFEGSSWFSEPITYPTSEPSDDVLDYYGQTMIGRTITT